MQIMITWQSIITAAAVLGAIVAIVTYFVKLVLWVNKQTTKNKEQDEEIKQLKRQHEDDVKSIKEEQTLLVFGVLGCLKGLQEQGCNGSVTQTIDKFEKYLNQKAHE